MLQFTENLSDRWAGAGVRSRINYKYLLGLPLSDAGFGASVLCEFRSRLVKWKAEALLFDRLLALCREHGFLVQHGRQRTDEAQQTIRYDAVRFGDGSCKRGDDRHWGNPANGRGGCGSLGRAGAQLRHVHDRPQPAG